VFVDYYEALQISPNADQETVHRVYRVQAQRFHPDNQETGDAAAFRSIAEAYEILSDPQKRADYDMQHRNSRPQARREPLAGNPASTLADEHRKRHEILTILYRKRLAQPDQPAMGLRDLLDLLGMAREQLEFSLWYLKEGGYLLRTDSARHSITHKGVELIETLALHRDQPLKIDDSRVA
jgi:curved DNA-binding protein